jgi:hypothetical protein
MGLYLALSMRSQTDCSSSAAVEFSRAREQISGAATQLEKIPENSLSENDHSSKSLLRKFLGQHFVQICILGGTYAGEL